jgi:hypothetical protein
LHPWGKEEEAARWRASLEKAEPEPQEEKTTPE